MRSFPYLRSTVKDRCRQRGFNSTASLVAAAVTAIAETTDANYSSVVANVSGRGSFGATPTDSTGKVWTANNGAKIVNPLGDNFGQAGVMAFNVDNVSGFSTPNSSDFNFPGDLTVEGWVCALSTASARAIASNYQGSSNGWTIQTNASSKITVNLTGDGADLTSSTSLVIGQWTHVAWTRSGSTNRLFMGGVQEASATDSTSITSTSKTWIGRLGDGFAGNAWVGFIHNFRVTKGVARYTAGFTPPTADFPTS